MAPKRLRFRVWKMGGLPCRDVIKIKGNKIQKASRVMPRSQTMPSDPSTPFLQSLLRAAGTGGTGRGRRGWNSRTQPPGDKFWFSQHRETGWLSSQSGGSLACELLRIQKSCAFSFRIESSSFPSSLTILAQGTHWINVPPPSFRLTDPKHLR